MGLVNGIKSASIFGKVAFVLLVVALLFIYIAFTTTGWGEEKATSGIHYGLWRRCTDAEYFSGCINLDGWALDWYAAVQAMAIFGFVGINVAFFLVCLLLFTSKCGGNKEVGMGASIVCIVTGILLLIGCIIFGAEFDDKFPDTITQDWDLSYGFGLAIVASLLEIVAGGFLLIDGLKNGTSPSG